MKLRYYMMLRHRTDRNRCAGFNRLLRSKAHGHRPAAIGGATRKLAAVADRADQHRHLVVQLEYFAGDFVDLNFLNLFAIERAERERRMQRAVHGTAPRRPERAFGASHLHGLMMFERGERLRNDGISSSRKM